MEGKYVCHVGDCVMSSEISLMVMYPEDIKYFQNVYMNFQEVPKDSWPLVGTETFVEL